jgi:uncharacterized OB-fold protein
LTDLAQADARSQLAVPIVDYLVLAEPPYLAANECTNCGARFFDRRNACASCFGTTFEKARLADTGELRAFSIVSMAAPGVQVPFVAATVDCAGTTVRANLVNIEPDAAHVQLGMRLRLATYPLGPDSAGVEAIGFGFEPMEADSVV